MGSEHRVGRSAHKQHTCSSHNRYHRQALAQHFQPTQQQARAQNSTHGVANTKPTPPTNNGRQPRPFPSCTLCRAPPRRIRPSSLPRLARPHPPDITGRVPQRLPRPQPSTSSRRARERRLAPSPHLVERHPSRRLRPATASPTVDRRRRTLRHAHTPADPRLAPATRRPPRARDTPSPGHPAPNS